MRVTLAQYQHLTPEQKARVTEIDASVADDYDQQLAKVRQAMDDKLDQSNEEQSR